MSAFSQSMFEGQLARYYDLMHKHRNYRRESEFLHKIVQRMCPGANRILDICCGTGDHAIRMAQAGYTVTGIDASQEMLGIARKKISAKRLRIDFRCSELSNLDFSEEFEVAYCLGVIMGRIEDLVKEYKDEWLLIKVMEIDELDRPIKGELILHSKNRDDIYEEQKKMKDDLYITYAGEIPQKGYAVAFNGTDKI